MAISGYKNRTALAAGGIGGLKAGVNAVQGSLARQANSFQDKANRQVHAQKTTHNAGQNKAHAMTASTFNLISKTANKAAGKNASTKTYQQENTDSFLKQVSTGAKEAYKQQKELNKNNNPKA